VHARVLGESGLGGGLPRADLTLLMEWTEDRRSSSMPHLRASG